MSEQEVAPATAPTSSRSITPSPAAPPRWRGIVARTCTVLFAVLAVLSIVTTWLAAELLDTDRYVETVSDLAADPAVQHAVSQRVSDQLVGYASTVLRGEQGEPGVMGSLPRAVSLQVIDRVVQDVVQSAMFQDMWITANRVAHPQVVSLLEGDADSTITASNGQVVLDLAPLVSEVQRRLSEQGIDLLSGLTVEPGVYTWVVFESEQLASAQNAVDLLLTLKWLLPVLAVVALALALVLAADRWRESVVVGLAAALVMVLVLVALTVVRNQVLDSLDGTSSVAAATALFDIVSESLRMVLRYAAAIGITYAALALVLRPASSVRAAIDRVVTRYRDVLFGVIVGAGCLIVILQEQPSVTSMLTVGVAVLLALALVWWIARAGFAEQRVIS